MYEQNHLGIIIPYICYAYIRQEEVEEHYEIYGLKTIVGTLYMQSTFCNVRRAKYQHWPHFTVSNEKDLVLCSHTRALRAVRVCAQKGGAGGLGLFFTRGDKILT